MCISIIIPSELVNGIEGYKISTRGRIKGRNGRINSGWDNNGYTHVSVGSDKSFQLHRLVAQTFLPNFYNKPTIEHKDDNKICKKQWKTRSVKVPCSNSSPRPQSFRPAEAKAEGAT